LEGKMSEHKPPQVSLPFGWIDDGSGGSICIPTAEFDFETVFKREGV
jgi:hypothetical protein